MKKITAVLMTVLMIVSIVAVNVSAANAAGEDPTPANIGTLYSSATNGIDVSYVRQFIDGNGDAFLAGGGVGAHGGHETRIVRTSNGTYATYITHATGNQSDDNNGWWTAVQNDPDLYETYKYYYNGIAKFDIIKVTATGFESLYLGEYPQAAGSCTPNIMFDGDHTVYVTVIADDKNRYGNTMGTSEFTNGIWLEVIEIDINTDEVSRHVGPVFYDHTTTPFEDHGYGYSQPCLDVAHGKLYCITNGGEAEDPGNTYAHQAGYMAWWVYDLNTHTFDPVCHTIERFSRRCYMNVYPDGNGGFTMVTERCAPSRELGIALNCTFSTSGYLWDALYVMHVPNPSVNYAEDTTIWEPTYTSGAKNFIASASHYGTSGCTYLDSQNRIHVIYSITYYTDPTDKTTKMSGVYHAMYSLSGEELYNQAIPKSLLSGNPGKTFKGPGGGFAMTQGPDGKYYIFVFNNNNSSTTLEIWSGTNGTSFTKKATGINLTLPNGTNVAKATKPIIGNTRNGSVLDGVIPIMIHTSGGDGDPYYYLSVKVPGGHTHSYTAVVTPPTVTEGGYTTYTCSCGDSYVSDYTDPLMNCYGSLTLEDSVDINIYVDNVPAEAVSGGYYVEYESGNGDVTQVAFSDAVALPDGQYKFTIASFNANQLGKKANFSIYDGAGVFQKGIDYSVKEYCDSVIGDPERPEGLKNVCSVLMAYGWYANARFPDATSEDYPPDAYSDAVSAVEELDAEDMGEYDSSVNLDGSVTGVSASLALKSKTELNFYVYGTGAFDADVFLDDEQWENFTVETISATKCRVTVTGLRPTDLTSSVIVIRPSDSFTIFYSPMAYAKYAASHYTNDANVCKALYLFAEAANDYFNGN